MTCIRLEGYGNGHMSVTRHTTCERPQPEELLDNRDIGRVAVDDIEFEITLNNDASIDTPRSGVVIELTGRHVASLVGKGTYTATVAIELTALQLKRVTAFLALLEGYGPL